VIVPLPDKLPIVSEKLAKSKVPFTTVAELFGITPAAPSFKVPAVIVVAPVYALDVLDNVKTLFCNFSIPPDPVMIFATVILEVLLN
jgi:hypothetical protein